MTTVTQFQFWNFWNNPSDLSNPRFNIVTKRCVKFLQSPGFDADILMRNQPEEKKFTSTIIVHGPRSSTF